MLRETQNPIMILGIINLEFLCLTNKHYSQAKSLGLELKPKKKFMANHHDVCLNLEVVQFTNWELKKKNKYM